MDRILISLKKENGPRASSAPALGLNTIIYKHVYWYMQQTQVNVYRTIGPLVFACDAAHMMSRLMGKPTICIGENKDADQLRGNREADQRLCFRYSDSTIPPLLNSKISSF